MEKQEFIDSLAQLIEFTTPEKMTVKDLKESLNLSDHYAILINGKRVSDDFDIIEGQKIIILPLIAGG